MGRSIKQFVWKILNTFSIGPYVQLYLKSYLNEIGWNRSFTSKLPIDAKGLPIPWYSYAAIHFLENRLQPHFEVFEFGCGHSTLWYANKVKHVTSVENDLQWFQRIQKLKQNNITLIHKPFTEGNPDYANTIFETGQRYHLIIVDGQDRAVCLQNAISALTPDGVIVLDNSERAEYQEGILFLLNKGFKRIDFYGMVPCTSLATCTTFFYRENNCLNI